MNVDKLYKINDNPLIFAGNGNCLNKLDTLLKNEKVTLLWHPSWRISIKSILKLVKTRFKFKKNGGRFVICCNSKEELQLCILFGLEAHLLNQNLHECEFEFTPQKTNKIYDAIYVAQARPFKRMHLANKIKKLFILTYGCKDYVNENGNDLSKFEPLISHASWNKSFIHDRKEISEIMSSSHCGLALSKREGAMWASVQYFLCGIPLVTTKSQGGRDFFYDSEYVTVVSANSDAVFDAVEKYKLKQIQPEIIRNKTLEKMKMHRMDYLNVLMPLLGKNNKESKVELYHKIWGSSNGIKRLIYEDTK